MVTNLADGVCCTDEFIIIFIYQGLHVAIQGFDLFKFEKKMNRRFLNIHVYVQPRTQGVRR
jgi:hypothetical protein